MEASKCNYCGIEFTPAKRGRKYCSDKCRETAHWKRQNEKRREATALRHEKRKKRKESDLARVNAEARAMGMNYGQYVAWKGVNHE